MYLRLLFFLTDMAIHIQYSTVLRRNLDGRMTKYRHLQVTVRLMEDSWKKFIPQVSVKRREIAVTE